jgi:hypothetical protein
MSPSVRRTFAALAMLTALGCDETAADPAIGALEPEPRAADFRSARVEQAIEAAAEVVETRGFASAGEPWRGFLVEHASEVREEAMRAGTCYVVLGAGSAAVRELNLRVFDSDGGAVVADSDGGALAALRFCPAQSGTYYVSVQAALGSGLFAVRMFRGPTGLEIRTDDLFREVTPGEPEPR